jgi:hypothetical protein
MNSSSAGRTLGRTGSVDASAVAGGWPGIAGSMTAVWSGAAGAGDRRRAVSDATNVASARDLWTSRWPQVWRTVAPCASDDQPEIGASTSV